ncbi:MAG TPA: hypothetical protein VLA75_07470, partial [Thermoanaerobaculia bacterium]|nr:hypothetical protein [Thermoanaerobaculia bacterium]
MLSAKKTSVREERSTRKAPLTDDEARALLAAVETVVIARGKRAERRAAPEVGLADLRGPSGNYRAPILRRGKTLLV